MGRDVLLLKYHLEVLCTTLLCGFPSGGGWCWSTNQEPWRWACLTMINTPWGYSGSGAQTWVRWWSRPATSLAVTSAHFSWPWQVSSGRTSWCVQPFSLKSFELIWDVSWFCFLFFSAVAPKFESIMEDVDVHVGQTSHLAVVVEGKPDPDILWFKVFNT